MENYNSSNIKTLEFDALIIGGGGSGMRTSLELAKSGLKTAVVSKVFPTRSHTVSAQGGITCAIASEDPNDDWQLVGNRWIGTRVRRYFPDDDLWVNGTITKYLPPEKEEEKKGGHPVFISSFSVCFLIYKVMVQSTNRNFLCPLKKAPFSCRLLKKILVCKITLIILFSIFLESNL